MTAADYGEASSTLDGYSDPVSSDGSTGKSWSPSGSQLLAGGALAAGAGGLGYMLSRGPGSLPAQYGQLEAGIPGMVDEAHLLEGQGGALVGQGTEALRMGQRGELTPEQQAQLTQFRTGETNKARQMYAGMGRNPDQDTAYLGTTADIDARVNAMAQEQIRSTIALGLGEISSGSSLIGQGAGFQSAANSALIAAGEAQMKLDKQYSDSLTSAFTAIGTMFGAMGKTAMMAA